MASQTLIFSGVLVFSIISLVFFLLATISAPIVSSFALASSNGYDYGVFGYCSSSSCSSVRGLYDAATVDSSNSSSWSLSSSVRQSISNVLIAHPVTAGLSLISAISASITLFTGLPTSRSSRKLLNLLFLLLSFLNLAGSILSFITDILLFLPHLKWNSWLVLGGLICNLLSFILLIISRILMSEENDIDMDIDMDNSLLNQSKAKDSELRFDVTETNLDQISTTDNFKIKQVAAAPIASFNTQKTYTNPPSLHNVYDNDTSSINNSRTRLQPQGIPPVRPSRQNIQMFRPENNYPPNTNMNLNPAAVPHIPIPGPSFNHKPFMPAGPPPQGLRAPIPFQNNDTNSNESSGSLPNSILNEKFNNMNHMHNNDYHVSKPIPINQLANSSTSSSPNNFDNNLPLLNSNVPDINVTSPNHRMHDNRGSRRPLQKQYDPNLNQQLQYQQQQQQQQQHDEQQAMFFDNNQPRSPPTFDPRHSYNAPVRNSYNNMNYNNNNSNNNYESRQQNTTSLYSSTSQNNTPMEYGSYHEVLNPRRNSNSQNVNNNTNDLILASNPDFAINMPKKYKKSGLPKRF